MLLIGCIFGLDKSISIKSAFLPTSNTSESYKPIALAPLTVAIFKTSKAGNAEGSFKETFCKA